MSLTKAVVIIGPTASGKTALAHFLCDQFRQMGRSCELVNLDAFQFYRGVTAGTAKPSPAEQIQYCYHGIDMLEPSERFDAQSYALWARKICSEIRSRSAVPLCVGGSGLYLRAFLHGLDPLPGKDDTLREFLRNCAATWGNAQLHAWLKAVDPLRALELHPNDKTRVERALELFLLTGKPPSQARTKTSVLAEQNSLVNAFLVHVDKSDTALQHDIKQRIPELFKLGFLNEVHFFQSALREKTLESCEKLMWQSLQAIGYPEVAQFMTEHGHAQALAMQAFHHATFQKLQDLIATRTWQYVRRQRTWNKKERCDARFETGISHSAALFENVLSFWANDALRA